MCSRTSFAGEGSCGRKMTLETWVSAGESHDLIFNCFWRSRWGQNDERNSSITGRISGRRSKKKQWKKTDTGWEKACSDKGSDMDESEPGNAEKKPQSGFWETRHSPTNDLISELFEVSKDNIRSTQNIIQHSITTSVLFSLYCPTRNVQCTLDSVFAEDEKRCCIFFFLKG